MIRSKMRKFYLVLIVVLSSCVPTQQDPVLGPDKQAIGTVYGGALGAGAGAVIAHEVLGNPYPGAWIGLGFGSLYGMATGMGLDSIEEARIKRDKEISFLQEVVWAHQILAENYRRRLELYPSRDIYPADLFFLNDSSTLSQEGEILVREMAHLFSSRMPWSRILIASYALSKDVNSDYQIHLAKKRAEQIGDLFVTYGIEPRRISIQPRLMSAPLVRDPADHPYRYAQAIEIIMKDY